MRRIKSFILVLTLILVVSFSIDFVEVSAKTVKHNGKTKSAAVKKSAAKKKAAKKNSTKKKAAKKKTSKKQKRSKSRSRRGRVYSRGSGSVLGEGSVVRVINYAKRYLGVNYDFGRSSSNAFDCSGFTMFIYRIAGINLPHSAAAQANLGLAVSRKDLEPGDLVFFETYRPGISHVGMYIGDDHFIHASSGAGEVTITCLSDPYYAERFRGGTRIIN